MPRHELSTDKNRFFKTQVPRALLALNAALALIYFFVIAFLFPQGNPVLFGLLIAGEVFHLWQALTFLHTIWDTEYLPEKHDGYKPPVDVFITVAGEPADIVEETARAAMRMRYPEFTVYLLNDGYVAGKDNWHEIEELAQRLGIGCITRTEAGGAKAGNINNAVRRTQGTLIAIFDADHIPHEDFLEKTVPYFIDPSMGFVQTPQFYKNHDKNFLSQSSWEQQELFFGPICKGKNRLNAATLCGTNMVLARKALVEVGGMCTQSIAEDFVTGMFMHERGYASVFVPEVLAEGLATEDLLSYSKQQFRWARGALDIIFRYNPLFRSGLTFAQKIQYLASASFFLSGAVVIMNAVLPLIYFFTGAVPLIMSGMLLAAVFLPYMFVTLYVLQRSSNFTFTFPSLAFSIAAFNIHLRALFAAATMRKSSFQITSKTGLSGNHLRLVSWHIAYIVLAYFGVIVAFMREGFTASLVNNLAWALINIAIFAPFIRAALPERETSPEPEPKPKRVAAAHQS